MKRKIICALAGFTMLFGLASCNRTSNPGGTSDSKGTSDSQQNTVTDDLTKSVPLKFNLAYGNRNQTMTYQYTNPLTMPDGTTVISQGQLKPMWSFVSKEINSTFSDVAIQDQKASEMITTAAATGFKDADIYGGNSIADNLMNYGVQGRFADLTELMNKGLMPDVKAYLDANPNIKSAITAYNGKIYHLPYIAEIGEFARDFHMRESWVKNLLDVETANYDTATYTTYYKGFWTGSNARTGANGGTVTPKEGVSVQKKTDQNVITLMNNLSSKTGASLAQCLKKYINDNYDYSNPSELYLGAKAAYDIDELVALFRVIKANPAYLTNGKATVVWPYFTRQSSYREELLRFGTYFDGVRVHGSDSYSARWQIDANGDIQYTYTPENFYNILTHLSDWNAEGLVYTDTFDTTNKNNYRNQLYFADTAENARFGFMTYDFTASTTADASSETEVRDIVGVLPPVSRVNGVWQYYIDNSRVIKPDGWAISASASEEVKMRAATLFNYFFTEKGAVIQNYGLDEMLKTDEKFVGPDGKEVPAYNDWTLNTAKTVANGDLSSFLRNWIGSLMPVGYQKEIGFEYQYTSQRGFDAWKLLQESTTNIPTYAGDGLPGDNPNYYTLIPPVFSLTQRQSETLANDTTIDSDNTLFEVIFNIIRYQTLNNAPSSVVLPKSYDEYYKIFKDAGIETYIATYQAAYKAMKAMN